MGCFVAWFWGAEKVMKCWFWGFAPSLHPLQEALREADGRSIFSKLVLLCRKQRIFLSMLLVPDTKISLRTGLSLVLRLSFLSLNIFLMFWK